MFELISSYIWENRWAVSYGLTVLFFVSVSNWRENCRQKIVSSAIFLLWLINIYFTEMTNKMTPVIFWATGDFLFGIFILLTAQKNKWQLGIGAWFIVFMAVHLSYWLYEPKNYYAEYNYWLAFTLCGWGQLLHVGYWYYKTDRYGNPRDLSRDFVKNIVVFK